MQTVTTFIATPEDLEAIMNRVVAPLLDRIRELEIQTGSTKHLYTTKEVGKLIGYSADMVRQFIREGKTNRKGKLVYLRAKELTKGEYRISPSDLDMFLSHF